MGVGLFMQRFAASKEAAPDPAGCWPWQATIDRDGYGRSGQQMAHRDAYEAVMGEIPPGLQIDHVCRNRSCVNPDHLEAVTVAENNRRRAEAQTHCLNGHRFTPETARFVLSKRGPIRSCRVCDAERQRQCRARKRAAVRP